MGTRFQRSRSWIAYKIRKLRGEIRRRQKELRKLERLIRRRAH